MSQTNVCSRAVGSSRQDVCPPKWCVTENGSDSCAKACASPKDSKRRPEAATSAWASLSRMSAGVSATGIEPRVPQNRKRMPLAAIESFRRLRRDRCKRLAQRGEHLEYHVEAADMKNLGNDRLHRGDHDPSLARPRFLGGEHQAAQPGARHIFQPGQVEHQRLAVAHAGLEMGR